MSRTVGMLGEMSVYLTHRDTFWLPLQKWKWNSRTPLIISNAWGFHLKVWPTIKTCQRRCCVCFVALLPNSTNFPSLFNQFGQLWPFSLSVMHKALLFHSLGKLQLKSIVWCKNDWECLESNSSFNTKGFIKHVAAWWRVHSSEHCSPKFRKLWIIFGGVI